MTLKQESTEKEVILDFKICIVKLSSEEGEVTEVICPGSQHVDLSRAQTHNLWIMSPASFHQTTHAPMLRWFGHHKITQYFFSS